MLHIEIQAAMAFFWAFSVSVFAIPSIIKVAHQKNLLDEPNKRTVHASLTPRLGGLAIFTGFVSAYTIFAETNLICQRIIAGAILLFFIGLKDDIISVSVFKKFFVQLLATGIIVFVADVRISDFQGVLGIHKIDVGFSYGFSFLVIVGITNAINLIDGLDGLAGCLTLLMCGFFGVLFYYCGNSNCIPFAFLAVCLAGGLVGFLKYNLKRAIIFMGDAGSLVCGFLIAAMSIEIVEARVTAVSPAIVIAIVIIPVFDSLRVFTIRILQGNSPFSPDKNHIHHVLMRYGIPQFYIVLLLCGITFICVSSVWLLESYGNNILLFGLFICMLLAAWVLKMIDPGYIKNLEDTQVQSVDGF